MLKAQERLQSDGEGGERGAANPTVTPMPGRGPFAERGRSLRRFSHLGWLNCFVKSFSSSPMLQRAVLAGGWAPGPPHWHKAMGWS